MSRFPIRYATAGEVTHLDALIFPGDERVSPDEGTWFIARATAPVAFAGVLTQGDDALFIRGGVRPSHRGQGLYKRMVRACEREARKEGAMRIWTYVLPWNAASINALIRCGWRAYTRQGGDPDCVYLGRTL